MVATDASRVLGLDYFQMTSPCPGCGKAGEISGRDGLFEVRGRLPLPALPRVRKCKGCGSGFVWQSGQALLLEASFWDILDSYWKTNNLDILSERERRTFYYPKDITPEGSLPIVAPLIIQSEASARRAVQSQQSSAVRAPALRGQPRSARKSSSFIDEMAPFFLLGAALLFLGLTIKEFSYASENASSLARVLAWGYLGAFIVSAFGARASYLASELRNEYNQAMAHIDSLRGELYEIHKGADELQKKTDNLQKEIEDLNKETIGLYEETDNLYRQIQELNKG